MTRTGRLKLFSLGHSNHEATAFVALLKRHQIDTLVDVRSAPYSRYCPQFNRPVLKTLLTGAAVRYVHMGDSLGGMPKGDRFYDERGKVRYEEVALASFFVEGIRRLVELMSDCRCAMMCAENPRRCHRHKLVEPALVAAGIDISHIRGDGQLESSEDLSKSEDSGQLRLF